MQLRNEFLDLYLHYVEDTESPRIFHIWSALSGIAAALGRRVYYPYGVSPIFPNMYTILVGPPAVKKSTSIKIMERLVKDATGVRFAPDDTAGKKQGLILEMEGTDTDEFDGLNGALDAAIAAADFAAIGNIQINLPDQRDRHTIFATAGEFASFIGQNQTDMLTFLIRVWDGDDYKYRIKASKNVLREPLLNVIAASTPSSIAENLPPQSIGGGFSSRLIFVFANRKYKSVPRPKQLDFKLEEKLKAIYRHAYYDVEGVFNETPKAAKLIDDLYEYKIGINDPRFVYYADRRPQHLIKLAMLLAVSRKAKIIDEQDVHEAHAILSATELSMPDALGEFGMSPLSVAKQKMVEFIRAARGPMPHSILWSVMHRDMKMIDFLNALQDLQNAGKIVKANSATLGEVYLYKEVQKQMDAQIIQELSQ